MGKSCRPLDKQGESLGRETQGREILEDHDNNIKMYLKNRVEGADWINLAWTFVNSRSLRRTEFPK
jgi:hypothetical protein